MTVDGVLIVLVSVVVGFVVFCFIDAHRSNRRTLAELAALVCEDCGQAFGTSAAKSAVSIYTTGGDEWWEFTCPHCDLPFTAQRWPDRNVRERPASKIPPSFSMYPLLHFRVPAEYAGRLIVFDMGPDSDEYLAFALRTQLSHFPGHPLEGIDFGVHGRPPFAPDDLVIILHEDRRFAYVRWKMRISAKEMPPRPIVKFLADQGALEEFLEHRRVVEISRSCDETQALPSP